MTASHRRLIVLTWTGSMVAVALGAAGVVAWGRPSVAGHGLPRVARVSGEGSR